MGFDRSAITQPAVAADPDVASPQDLSVTTERVGAEPVEPERSVAEETDPPGVRIRVHPGLCQGWGECHRWAPDLYPLDAEGHVDVHLLEVPPEHALRAWIAARSCPEQAITVIGPPDEYWLARLRRAHES